MTLVRCGTCGRSGLMCECDVATARGIGAAVNDWHRANSECMTEWARQGLKTYAEVGVMWRRPEAAK